MERNTGQAYQVDISTSLATVRAGMAAVLADFGGRLDVFVANAGVAWMWGPMGDVADVSDGSSSGAPTKLESLYSEIVRTNLDGTMWCARAAGEVWRSQKEKGTVPGFREGSFVATASMSAHVVNVPQLQAAYNASKAAVVHLCLSSLSPH